ncbi:uncharacterized protein DUF559 [Mumia flava]|uniref:Uncharacterized protein DUF559 n=1 Tax=Mumia flava TaxID=1348852 RepID=A0A0B2BV81_9ACTN|nr:type IV toxin-antitoxin system AbiEi family antitoxin domain-containing protein [Mumia flava]PJJ54164.1 uncharacterized protein DUF559 [Mumia flava]
MHRLEPRAIANGGYVTRREAVDCGVSDAALQRAVDGGVLVHLHRGVYAPVSWRRLSVAEQTVVRLRAVLAHVKPGHVGTHDSAIAVHGLATGALVPDGLDLDRVHLAHRDGTTSRRTGALHYHRGPLEASEIVEIGGVPVTEPVRAVATTMTTLDLDDGTVLASGWLASRMADARRRGMVELYDQEADRSRLVAQLDTLAHWTGAPTARDAAAIADARCDSVGEVRVLVMLWRYGIERPEPQYEIAIGPDRHAEVDFCWPEARLVVEFDGKQKYEDEGDRGGPSAATKVMNEKRREKAIEDLGFSVVRVTWIDLLPQNQERTAARIRSELARAYRRARAGRL